MTKSIIVILGLIMLISSFQSSYDDFLFLDSYAQTTSLNVTTDRAFYQIGDTVEIMGSVENPSDDILIITVFNSDADAVLEDQVTLDEKNSFKTTILLSDKWEDSNFYVITTKMNDIVTATTFELKLSDQETQTTPDKEESPIDESPVIEKSGELQKFFDNFYQNPLFAYIIMLIIILVIAGILIGIAYSRKLPNVERLKHKPQPLVTFENPAPAQVRLKDDTKISYESWEHIPADQKHNVATIEFWIKIKNNGGDTARNVSSIFFQEDGIFTREYLVNKEMKMLPDLAPGEFYFHNFEISWDRFIKLQEHNVFVGLLISYAKQQTHSYSGIIFGIGMGSNYIIDEWFT